MVSSNTQDQQAGKCLLVDYDGTKKKDVTDSAVVAGKTLEFPVKGAAPTGLARWANGAMDVQVVTGAPGQSGAAAQPTGLSSVYSTAASQAARSSGGPARIKY